MSSTRLSYKHWVSIISYRHAHKYEDARSNYRLLYTFTRGDDASNDSARASEAEGLVTDAQDDGIIAKEVAQVFNNSVQAKSITIHLLPILNQFCTF